MTTGKPRKRQWSLSPRAEAAYRTSQTRRGKASRGDYMAGYEDGFREALEEMQRTAQELQKEMTHELPDVRVDTSAA